ncbi:MAG: Plastocyanin [Parcubacteria group bacterium GW2011_GWA1_47_10]|uniref:EfeO-type cupredoxin-like domain-containing protein n=1 Tax=Candidatus Zambryskibacteria bacterium RIFCSPHIGHO2_01_FULL_46_25 TaxID=1802738 RepID=A0A1G2T0H9_9BACT|nr:MAG: Plastocyanin [Parcubacteria group bacterium GW2011_GWA1_47_10]OHA90339.1 MAG: hypothetical protein A2838_01930 [Candidatus Zambryskibacteria bacterium RIFCSPHIGHO2_01_FULL_46_25]
MNYMKYILIIIALALVFWGGYKIMNKDAELVLMDSEVKTFVVVGKPFSFTPSEIRVKEGDTVRIVFQNEQGTHDWVIDEFDARTQVLQANQSETIDFRATKKGSFEFYCSVGNHRAMGMKGALIVE